jgi:hypothetical protein
MLSAAYYLGQYFVRTIKYLHNLLNPALKQSRPLGSPGMWFQGDHCWEKPGNAQGAQSSVL